MNEVSEHGTGRQRIDDPISRQAVLDLIADYDLSMGQVVRGIHALPSVHPEPHWIPCSERLPENDDWLIVTVLDECGDTPFRYTDFGWYLDVGKCWIVDSEQRTDVIAWMPLPKPWKEGESDKRAIDVTHGRIFQEIVVEYPSISTYIEYEGKPYFSIKYMENGQEFIGYGTYKPEALSEYLKEYFMPSVQSKINS